MDLDRPCSSLEFGRMVGISDRAVDEHRRRGTLVEGDSAGQWLLAYCNRLRAQAAGRSADGLDLASERARLASEQADKVAMDNAIRRRELMPVDLLAAALADVGRQLVARLEAIPVQIRRQVGAVDPKVLAIVDEQLQVARNAAANIELSDNFADGPDADQTGGGPWPGGPQAQTEADALAMGG